MSNTARINYRKDIDALRGVAVLLVIFDHLHINLVPAGFLGVDVFFVISGFLITQIIFRNTKTQTFSLTKFYLNRMRRILPALMLVLLVSSVMSYFLLLVPDLKNYSTSLLATILSSSNIYFWKFINIGYFSTDATIQQLLHTWSLGVEEQFYLIWPIILIVLTKKFTDKKIILGTILLTIISFFAYFLLRKHPLLAYYSPITRAFELLTGALVALNFDNIPAVSNKYLKNLGSILGLFLIIYPACAFTNNDFPSIKILLPCLGTALLIYTGKNNQGFASKIIENRILVFIGLISYSLYLWHWPLISYLNYLKIPINFTIGFVFILILLLTSTFTYKFVELPFRNKLKLSFLNTMLLFFILPLALAVIFYLFSQYKDNFGFNKISPEKLNQVNTYYGLLKQDYGCIDNKDGFSVLPSEKLCTIGDYHSNKKTVLVVGDSHASAYVGMLHVLLSDQHLQAYVVNQSGTPFILGNISNWRENNPMSRNELLRKLIKNKKYDYVVMGGFWDYYPDLPSLDGKKHPPFEVFKKGLREAVKFIVDNKSIPVIMFDNPPLINLSKTCGLTRVSFLDCSNNLREVKKIQNATRNIILNLKNEFPQLILIDPTKIICDKSKCYTSINGTPLYFDEGANSHLNYDGSTLIGKLYLKKFGNPF
ncbi:TPA: acyltransferase, partial [Legionella pneumophila]|nr:acyltransferase [Legionella pneumophila]HAU0379226.1 acyltransferase [Legionella pneumophila]